MLICLRKKKKIEKQEQNIMIKFHMHFGNFLEKNNNNNNKRQRIGFGEDLSSTCSPLIPQNPLISGQGSWISWAVVLDSFLPTTQYALVCLPITSFKVQRWGIVFDHITCMYIRSKVIKVRITIQFFQLKFVNFFAACFCWTHLNSMCMLMIQVSFNFQVYILPNYLFIYLHPTDLFFFFLLFREVEILLAGWYTSQYFVTLLIIKY